MGLALHLRSGAAVDKAEAATWMASRGRPRFMTLSSDGWRDANIAAGADERGRAGGGGPHDGGVHRRPGGDRPP